MRKKISQANWKVIDICKVRLDYNRPCYDCKFRPSCSEVLSNLNTQFDTEKLRPSDFFGYDPKLEED